MERDKSNQVQIWQINHIKSEKSYILLEKILPNQNGQCNSREQVNTGTTGK